MTNAHAHELTLYIGGYSKVPNGGLSVAKFNTHTGALSQPVFAASTPNPSFLALAASGKYLYAANESGAVGGGHRGGLSAFAIDDDSCSLKPLNAVAVGGGICHVGIDASGKYLLTAAYGDGFFSVWKIEADGRIGQRTAFVQHTKRVVKPPLKSGPHVHQFVLSPDNRFAFAVDLGLDKVFIYRFCATTGTVSAADPPFAETERGAGPRHMSFSSDGRFAYLINEYGNSIDVFGYSEGNLRRLQTVSTLPADFTGQSHCAEILVHPSGKWVYGSNRGRDSVAAFKRDEQQGTLKWIGEAPTEGRFPRNFVLSPDGNWLLAANQKDSSIIVFRINPENGMLVKGTLLSGVPGEPTCLRFGT
jgi:6-phosphogluconolactonase